MKLAGSRSHKNVNLLAIHYHTLEKNRYTLKLVENHSQIISNFLRMDLPNLQEGTFTVRFVGDCLKTEAILQTMHSSTLEIRLLAVGLVINHSH